MRLGEARKTRQSQAIADNKREHGRIIEIQHKGLINTVLYKGYKEMQRSKFGFKNKTWLLQKKGYFCSFLGAISTFAFCF